MGVLTVGAPAWAQTPPSAEAVREARERFGRGVELSQENRFDAAMVEFRRAYELTHNPAVLYNISITHEALGQFVEALEAMENYLRDAPAAVVDRNRADAQTALRRLRGRVGTLQIAIDHPGLEVRLNNVVMPMDRLRTGMRVNSGRLRLSFSAPGRVSEDREVELAGGDVRRVSEPLREIQTTIGIECNVAGAEVLIDGQRVAETPVVSPLSVTEGSHNVEVRRPGYVPYTSAVVARGTGARLTVQLAWLDDIPPTIASRLVVVVNESTAVGYLDGRRVAVDGSQPMPPGAHRLRLERDNFLPVEQEVRLAPGQQTQLRVNMQPTPAYREQYFASARPLRIGGGILLGVGGGALIGGAIGMGLTLPGWIAAGNNYNATSAQYMMMGGNPANPVCPTQLAPMSTIMLLSQNRLPDGSINPTFLRSTFTAPGGMQRAYGDLLGCQVGADAAASDASNHYGDIASIVVTGVGFLAALTGVVMVAIAPPANRFDRRVRRQRPELPFLLGGGPNYVTFGMRF